MVSADRIIVQSIAAAGGFPVAVDYGTTGVGTVGYQQMQLSSGGQVAGGVTVTGSVGVGQLGAPWSVTGSVQATQVGSWVVTANAGTAPFSVSGTVVASVIGQATVTASIAGVPAVVGSVGVTQISSPWITQPASLSFATPQGAIVGSVGASQLGAWTTVASVIGVPTVSGSMQATQQGSWVVTANQGGAPWSTVGSALTYLVDGNSAGIKATVRSYASGNPVLVAFADPTGTHTTVVSVAGTIVASVIGQPTITASIIGIPTIAGSVGATQLGSWSNFLVGLSGDPSGGLAVGVTSYASGNLLRVDLVKGTLSAGADGRLQDRANTAIMVSVTSDASGIYPLATSLVASGLAVGVQSYGGGNLLRVNVAAGGAGDGRLQDGVDTTILATVRSYSGSKPLAVALTDLTGTHTTVVSVAGTVVASVIGQPTVTASLIGQPTVTASIVGVPTFTGSVQATQQGSWQVNVGAISNVASTTAFQGGAPWTVTGSVLSYLVDGASAGIKATVRSYASGNPIAIALSDLTGAHTTVLSVAGTIVASVIGQVTMTASVIGIPTFVGSVVATQGGAPWTVTASTQSTQQGSWIVTANQGGAPWTMTGSALTYLVDGASAGIKATVRSYASGNPIAFALSDLTGAHTTVLSVAGTVVASVIGQVTVTASVIGNPTILGSVGATQLGAPWTVTGSMLSYLVDGASAGIKASVRSYANGNPQLIAFADTTGAHTTVVSIAGTIVASVIGQPTITASVIGVPTVVGSVGATQLGSWSNFLVGLGGDPAGGLMVGVTSYNLGNLLRVDLVKGTISGADGRLQDRTDTTIMATVRSDGSGIYPLAVTLVASGVAASVQSYGGGNFQRVNFAEVNTAAIGQFTVNSGYLKLGTAAAGAPLGGRRKVTIVNKGPANLYLGFTTASNNTGLLITPGGAFSENLGAGIDVCGATDGSSAFPADVRVHEYA